MKFLTISKLSFYRFPSLHSSSTTTHIILKIIVYCAAVPQEMPSISSHINKDAI